MSISCPTINGTFGWMSFSLDYHKKSMVWTQETTSDEAKPLLFQIACCLYWHICISCHCWPNTHERLIKRYIRSNWSEFHITTNSFTLIMLSPCRELFSINTNKNRKLLISPYWGIQNIVCHVRSWSSAGRVSNFSSKVPHGVSTDMWDNISIFSSKGINFTVRILRCYRFLTDGVILTLTDGCWH